MRHTFFLSLFQLPWTHVLESPKKLHYLKASIFLNMLKNMRRMKKDATTSFCVLLDEIYAYEHVWLFNFYGDIFTIDFSRERILLPGWMECNRAGIAWFFSISSDNIASRARHITTATFALTSAQIVVPVNVPVARQDRGCCQGRQEDYNYRHRERRKVQRDSLSSR